MHQKLLSWVFLLGFCVVLASHALAQGSAPGRIVLARVTGEVTLTAKDTKAVARAANNAVIAAGTIVTTGKSGSAVLVFSNGSTINLGEDSVLDIETFLQDPFEDADVKVADMAAEPTTSTTKLNLTRGELVGNVKKLNKDKGSSFTVQTPVGAAGIRGTTFRIVFRPDPVNPNRVLFTLSTAEGLVDVNMHGGANVPVPVPDNREIVVEVNVEINATTGAVTVTAPPQVVTQDIPPQTQASIATAVQTVLEAVQNVPVPTTSTPPSNDNSNGENTDTPPPEDTSKDKPSDEPPTDTPPPDTQPQNTDTPTTDSGTPPPPPPATPPPPQTTPGAGK